MTDTETATPGAGHNMPPSDLDLLREKLTADHAGLAARQTELLAAIERTPEVVTEDNAGAVSDQVKQIAMCIKSATTQFTAAKKPHLDAGRAVEQFFRDIRIPLETGKLVIEVRLGVHLATVEKARRAALVVEQEAAQANAKRLADEAEKAAAKINTEADLEQAIAVDEAAHLAEDQRISAAAAAQAKPADLSRTRGSGGSVASLRVKWVGSVTNYDELPLDALRQYIPHDALDRAVKAYVKAGGRTLAGAFIREQSTAGVR